MCHRYNIRATSTEIASWFGAEIQKPFDPAQKTLFPLADVPVVLDTSEGRVVTVMSWGLVPFWWKPGKKTWKATARSCFNAKSETAHEKPSFRKAFKTQRCLIPATSFFEKDLDFQLKQSNYFAMAGLWDRCQIDGDEHLSCTILTTAPNSCVEKVHHRMPVILDDDDKIRQWLSPDIHDRQPLERLFEPIPGETMSTQAAES
ncbi:SOS response-associated peptidase [Bremerella cremea]|uniref:SOS response-associated peptidase n=1 Tax=Bremerella cremea TaxID=1031537 RepID=UPI0031ED4214